MEEFRIAHAQVTEKSRKNFLIPLLYEDVEPDDLDADLKLYVETHTYIETKNLVKSIKLKVLIVHTSGKITFVNIFYEISNKSKEN